MPAFRGTFIKGSGERFEFFGDERKAGDPGSKRGILPCTPIVHPPPATKVLPCTPTFLHLLQPIRAPSPPLSTLPHQRKGAKPPFQTPQFLYLIQPQYFPMHPENGLVYRLLEPGSTPPVPPNKALLLFLNPSISTFCSPILLQPKKSKLK